MMADIDEPYWAWQAATIRVLSASTMPRAIVLAPFENAFTKGLQRRILVERTRQHGNGYQIKAYKGGAVGQQCRCSGNGHRATASGRPWFAKIAQGDRCQR